MSVFFKTRALERKKKRSFSLGLLVKTRRELPSTKAAFLLCFFDVFEKGRETTTTQTVFISNSSHSL